MFPKFHGINLAANAWIANATVESLSSDPTAATAGRIWYNSTSKLLKFSSLDGGGAVVVQTMASGADVQAALDSLASLGTRVTTIEGAYVKKDGSVAFTGNIDAGGNKVTNAAAGTASSDLATKGQLDSAIAALGNAFKYIGTVAGGADAGAAVDLTGLSATAVGDYYKVSTTGYFKVGAEGTPFLANQNDGLVFNTASGVDVIDNTDSNVTGTTNFISVTGSADTGFAVDIDANFKGRMSAAEAAITAEVSRAEGVEGTLSSLTTSVKTNLVAAINSEVSRATTAEGTLNTAITNEVTRAQGAETTLQSNIDAEVTRAEGVEGTLASLTTDAKTNLVAAINEVDAHADANATAISAETTRATGVEGTLASLTTTAKGNLVAAINEVNAAVATETTRATGVEGSLASLTTDAKGTLVAAINEVDAHADAANTAAAAVDTKVGSLSSLTTTDKTDIVSAINEVAAAAGTGTGALKTQINSQRYVMTASSASLTHVITHGLGSAYTAVQVWVKGDDNVFRNDIVAVEETSSNQITVTLTESRIIKVAIQALDQLS